MVRVRCPLCLLVQAATAAEFRCRGCDSKIRIPRTASRSGTATGGPPPGGGHAGGSGRGREATTPVRAPATRRKGFIGGFLDGFIGTPTVPRNSPDAARAKELYRAGWRFGQLTGYDGRDLGPVEVAARVGDPGRAGAVLTVRDHAGHESVFMADRIRDFRWYDPGNRHIAFGFGATGIMAAGIAQTIEGSQADWEASIVLNDAATMTLRVTRWPPQADLRRAVARLAGAA